MSDNTSNAKFSISDLESVFRSNYKSLCFLSYRITNSKETAEDIVQDCFFKLWNSRDKILVKVSLKAYLYRSVANASLNHIRLAKKHSDLSTIESLASDEEKSYIEEERDISLKIKDAIESLPPKCRAIFMMSRYDGMKYKEIADTLSISVKTVENQMSIAFEKLRDKLKELILAIALYFFI